MTAIADAQYGPDVAELYDAVIGAPIPPEPTIEAVHDLFAQRKVLDVGVGTGRIAIPLAQVAAEVIGVDNSVAMIEQLQAKDIPANLKVELADFRSPLPFADHEFEGAISTLGSFACVRSEEQLVSAFENVARVLRPETVFFLEYYCQFTYQELSRAGRMEMPNEHHPSRSEVVVKIHDDVLTAHTTVTPDDGGAPTSFDESVLLPGPRRLQELAERGGFAVIERTLNSSYGPFDTWILSKVG